MMAQNEVRAQDGTRSLLSGDALMIYGVIDPFCEAGQGVRAIDVVDTLLKFQGPKIKARINSPGGSVVEALAIYNALKNDPRPCEVQIDAMAASAASVVAMAGDEIMMAESATIMIHDPWAFAMGGSSDLRAQADEIDRQKDLIVGIYASRTGCDPDEICAMMASETYLCAEDAMTKGFCTGIVGALAVAACDKLDKTNLARLLASKTFAPAPAVASHAAPAANLKENPMTIQNMDQAGVQNAAPDANALQAVRDEAIIAERTRVSTIQNAVRSAKLPDTFAQSLIDSGAGVDKARESIIDAWAKANEGPEIQNKSANHVVTDEREKFIVGASLGVSARAGQKGGERNEFSGMTLRELARESLRVRNDSMARSSDTMAMIGRAFTVRNEGAGQSTSDFANILANIANKGMMKGWDEAEETFDKWTSPGTLPDFKSTKRVDLNLFPALSQLDEGTEYNYATVGDRGETIQLATYGNKFRINRQVIINDDLNMLTKVPSRMGRAARRTIGNLVYAVLTGNPNMSDSVALFHANHKNLLTGGSSVLSSTSLISARAKMATQQDPDARATGGLNIRPKYLLVPAALEGLAGQLIRSSSDPAQANAGVANPAANMAEVLADARLDAASTTAWYLTADAGMYDTIEVAYLNGVQAPTMEQQLGWDVDGVEMKIRIDAGVKALDFRTMLKSNGA
jgi:ATP-dependent protease ClpP protease subunit